MIHAKPITVLVVYDEPHTRRFVYRALEQEGWGALELQVFASRRL